MVDIFITDSRDKYQQNLQPHRIIYSNGTIEECSFIDKSDIEEFNGTLIGLEDEAHRLMLEKMDEDVQTIIDKNYQFDSNSFISRLPAAEKVYSTLFSYHRHFAVKKYLFQLVLDRFFLRFSIQAPILTLALSEDYSLTRDLPYNIKSAGYSPAFKNIYSRYLIKQGYYFLYHLFSQKKKLQKTNIAIFLLDIPNEFDLIRRFVELIKKQDRLKLTIVLIDSNNPADKRVDPSQYIGPNVEVTYLHHHKKALLTNYSSFYSVCSKLDPLYSVYKKARICEQEDILYGFTDELMSTIRPDVCLYLNIQEYGRVMANVCAAYNIPTICVEYAFAFDTYIMEKRIRFDVRACMSEVTAQNWRKRKDPTPRHEIIGFCKIDDWQEKLAIRKSATEQKPFDNSKRTILFVSTWAPNPNSPLLTEKAKIAEELSEACHRNGWNLLIKKHPSEFDTLVNDVFNRNKYADQKIVEHAEMPLFDCVYYSDFVCTQNSSAFVETLYLNKPFAYITVHGVNLWANLSYFSREKIVGNFSSIGEYEQYLLANSGDEAYEKLVAEFMKLQTKFLYKTDGNASERLLELASSFVK